jgi:outer membrane protein assembly factor BamB
MALRMGADEMHGRTTMSDEQNKMTPATEAPGNFETAYKTAYGVAVVAGVFSLVVAVLLAVNWFQTRNTPSITSTSIQKLITQLSNSPDNDSIKEEIRAFDLLARRAYFTGVSVARKGTCLFAIGIGVLLIALKTMAVLRRKLPDPRLYLEPADAGTSALLARWFVVGIGIFLFIAALLLAGIFGGDLNLTMPVPQGGAAHPLTTVHSEDSRQTAEPKGAAVLPLPPAPAVSDEEISKNWPCFRGPGGLGVAHYTNAPAEWDGKTGKNILWKVAVPRQGCNSPIVWGNRVLVSGADKDVREVFCFDAASGQLLWRHEVKGIPDSPAAPPVVTPDTGFAAATMATDGNMRFFAIFATGDLVCLDHCANRLWARNLGMPEIRYGHSSSLIVYRNILIVQYDSNKSGRLLGLDCATGKTLWETARKVDPCWSSPILVNTGKRMELIINANPLAAGYDPQNGKELWALECMGGEVGPSPGYADGMVFVANEFVRLAAIKLGDKPQLAWEGNDGLPNVASPLATSEYVFLASSGGTVTCWDAKKGGTLWKQELTDGFYSSPILVGDRIYLTDLAGATHMIKADKTYLHIGSCELEEKRELGEKVVCTPAFMDGRIYIRGEKNLYCIGEKQPGLK